MPLPPTSVLVLAAEPSPTSPAAGPLLVAAVLLVVAGAAKVARPDGTVRALHAIGVPAGRPHGRLLGAAEATVGALAVLAGGAAAAAVVAAFYAGFAAAAALLVARRPGAGCGCFGASDAPATRTHVALDALLAAGALWAVLRPPAGLVDVLSDQPLLGLPLLGLVGTGAVLVHAAMTSLPALQHAARPAGAAQ